MTIRIAKKAAMNPSASPLLTDLYQINMIQAYLDHGDTKMAVFEFFARTLPKRRGSLIAAGVEQALDFLENLRFSAAEIAWLESTGRSKKNLLDYLDEFRFGGDVHAMPEGSNFDQHFAPNRATFLMGALFADSSLDFAPFRRGFF